MTEKLKPCPFCGGKAELRKLTYQDTTVFGVFCLEDLKLENQHGHFIDNYANKEEAIDAWNRRVDTTKQQLYDQQLYDALRAILDVQLNPAFKETLSNALKLTKRIEEDNNVKS